VTFFITKNRLIIFALLTSVLLALGSWVIQLKIESDSQKEIGRYLRSELNMTHQAVRSWVKVHRASTLAWANTLEMRQFAQALLIHGGAKERLLEAIVQNEVQHWLAPVVESNGYEGFSIIGPGNFNLSASDNSDIGEASRLLEQPKRLKDVWAGFSLVTLPQRLDESLKGELHGFITGQDVMFSAAPIRNELGQVIAILSFRIDPSVGFSPIFKRSWNGMTGEVYAFDNKGLLISESRFNDQLHEAGLIKLNQKAMLNISLREFGREEVDGGKGVTSPLTLMTKKAIFGLPDVNLEGYRSYYDASEVVGAWLWDSELRLGVSAEIKKKELFRSIYSNRVAISSATFFSIIFFLAMMAVFIRNRAQILEREIRQRTVLNTIAEGVITTTSDGTIEAVNPAVESIFGYQASELIGESIIMLMPKYYGDLHTQPIFGSSSVEVSKSIVNLRQEVIGLHKREGGFPIEITVCEMHIDDQHKYNCTLRDITERKEAELALRESERQFRMILVRSPVPMMVIDKDDNIELFNQKFVELFGWSSEDISTLEAWWEAAYPDEDYRGEVAHEWEQVVKEANIPGKDIAPQEWMLTCKSGDVRMTELRMMPVGGGRNVVVMSDITERIRAETVLIDARKQAESATKAKSEFLAVMSHEIRTPMNGVLGMAQLLRKSPLNKDQHLQVEILYQAGKSLLNIINDILDFSKVEAGKLKLELTEFDLEQSILQICHLLTPKAEEKGIELIMNYSHDSPRLVVADKERLRQIMLNLVGNAIKFTESGHVVVRVRKESEKDGCVDLRIEVQDSGIGIDIGGEIDAESRLFHSFSQADASTTRRFGGTGLGLAITKQLVGLMGGNIGVNSAPGLGSTFWVTLTVPLAGKKGVIEGELSLVDLPLLLISESLDSSAEQISQLKKLAINVEAVVGAKEGEQRLKEAADNKRPFKFVLLDCLLEDDTAFIQTIKPDTVLIFMGEKWRYSEGEMLSSHPRPASIKTLQQLLLDALVSRKNHVPRTLVKSDALEALNKSVDAKSLPANLHLLLVEDNLVNQKVAGAILKKLNFKVDVASNGVEALSCYKDKNYDLILMDCLMPQMDGYLATQKIREIEQETLGYVPIIALTADALCDNKKRCFDVGMDDYLTKPFEIDELKNKLLKWLGKGKKIDDKDKSAQRVIDTSATAEMRKVLGDDFLEVVDAFLESVPTILIAMHEAKVPYDAEAMRRHAHSLKSCSANVGAMHLSSLAIQLEQAIKDAETIDFDEQIAQLQQAFKLAEAALKDCFKHES
jgi:PAS domain S-box-containing protein